MCEDSIVLGADATAESCWPTTCHALGFDANSPVAGSMGLLGENVYGIRETSPPGPVELAHKAIWA